MEHEQVRQSFRTITIWLVKIDAMDGSQEKIISTRKCMSQNEGHSVAPRAHLPFEFLMGTLATWMHSDIQYKLSIHAQIVCIWCPGCIDIWLFDHILLRKGYESNTYALGDYRNFVRALPCIHSYPHDCKTNVRTVVDMSYCSKERQHNICNDHPYSLCNK